jgi:hypothetical protein
MLKHRDRIENNVKKPWFVLLGFLLLAGPPAVQAQPAVVVPPPVLRWKMNEGSGTTAADSSGNGYTGTLSGVPDPAWITPSARLAGFSTGLSCETNLNRASYAYLTGKTNVGQLANAQHASISCWICQANAATGDTGDSATAGFSSDLTGSNEFTIDYDSDEVLFYVFAATGGVTIGGTVDAGFLYPYGSFAHCVLTFDGTQSLQSNQLVFYVNGVAQTITWFESSTTLTALPSASALGFPTLGYGHGGNDSDNPVTSSTYAGAYGDMQVFDITLTQAQVISIYNAGAQSDEGGPVGYLRVYILPALAVTDGARWQVDGAGPFEQSGAAVTNLTLGRHTVNFTNLSGWTTPATQTILIRDKLLSGCIGAYTFGAKGIYNGLFAQADTNVETSGLLSGLDVTASGTYSGRLFINGSISAIYGSFNASGLASNSIARADKQAGPLTLDMTLNWNDSPPYISGTVSGTNGGAWTANLTAGLASNSLGSAAYTTLLLPSGTPPGCGYLLITNHEGAVSLSGYLADGTFFSQSVPLSGDGDLPVYGNLYNNTGLLLGLISLESGAPVGNLTWIKEASHFGVIYTNGFTNLAALQGSHWTNPAPHTAAIDLAFGLLDVSGGNLVSTLAFTVAATNNYFLVKLTNAPTNYLIGTIDPLTGLLIIRFGNGDGRETTVGKGAVLQNGTATNAGGYFLGTTNAGSILLLPGI